MAYRGEDINITIKGDDEYNLDELEFGVWIYPDRQPNALNWEGPLRKGQLGMTRIGDNHYNLKIPRIFTTDLPLGLYTIEVVIFDGEHDGSLESLYATSRSIFVKQGAFPVYDSASKNIE